MAEFLLSFVFLLAIVAAMAIGVIRGRAPISGTCGGLNNVGISGACEICGGDTSKCEEENPPAKPSNKSEFYDAS
ncbi:MAG: hypothetical protein ACI9FB_000849 [Candidatus Azotimanducaceae bacterium]|jgi:hypothetical protein